MLVYLFFHYQEPIKIIVVFLLKNYFWIVFYGKRHLDILASNGFKLWKYIVKRKKKQIFTI